MESPLTPPTSEQPAEGSSKARRFRASVTGIALLVAVFVAMLFSQRLVEKRPDIGEKPKEADRNENADRMSAKDQTAKSDTRPAGQDDKTAQQHAQLIERKIPNLTVPTLLAEFADFGSKTQTTVSDPTNSEPPTYLMTLEKTSNVGVNFLLWTIAISGYQTTTVHRIEATASGADEVRARIAALDLFRHLCHLRFNERAGESFIWVEENIDQGDATKNFGGLTFTLQSDGKSRRLTIEEPKTDSN